ncbi:hypothetical protein BJY04DRAFT_202861 [Aspergillus karnatakaensis]|uniref:uncharacterized protein n=1 Tax=Aspergillus karnatakaensis TaxID=1810916 RepID=UPI003CCDF391
MSGWWDDFANNLATDLAPLVALFGDAPTKQYLSECLTMVDIIIFAIAPLGIITGMVSAIRVSGPPSLRAFIGRAQEGAAAAEAELSSSTSRDVCELYNNGGIARVLGRPKLLEIFHDQHATKSDFTYTFLAESTPGVYAKVRTAGIYLFQNYLKRSHEWTLRTDGKDIDPPYAGFAPRPNLTLNVGMRAYPPWLVRLTALGGLFAQCGILVWAGIARYRLGWSRGDVEDRYAVPTLVCGTLFLGIGMMLCASLVVARSEVRIFQRTSTSEPARSRPGTQFNGDQDFDSITIIIPPQKKLDRYVTPEPARSRPYWVQPGTQFIGDQGFDYFVFSHPPQTQFNRYITSWREQHHEPKTPFVYIAVISSLLGFILQFLGLRACHRRLRSLNSV